MFCSRERWVCAIRLAVWAGFQRAVQGHKTLATLWCPSAYAATVAFSWGSVWKHMWHGKLRVEMLSWRVYKCATHELIRKRARRIAVHCQDNNVRGCLGLFKGVQENSCGRHPGVLPPRPPPRTSSHKGYRGGTWWVDLRNRRLPDAMVAMGSVGSQLWLPKPGVSSGPETRISGPKASVVWRIRTDTNVGTKESRRSRRKPFQALMYSTRKSRAGCAWSTTGPQGLGWLIKVALLACSWYLRGGDGSGT